VAKLKVHGDWLQYVVVSNLIICWALVPAHYLLS